MTKDELKKAAIRHALNGGRKFGSAEHKTLMRFIADQMVEQAKDKAFLSLAADAIVELANQSALQQALDSAGLIDRLNRKAVRTTLFSELAAEKEKS